MRVRLAIGALCLALVSCQFERRSADYACETQTDCSSGRICAGGWCIEGDDSGPVFDADPNAPDARVGPDASFVCPPPPTCSRCDGTICVISCDTPDSCATQTICPAGYPCRVECNGTNSCNGGIDCSAADSCRVECIGPDSCQGLISCGTGACRVECTDTATCTAGIDCATSCQCDTICSGTGSCQPVAPTCPSVQCTGGSLHPYECDSMPGPCHSCI